MGQFKYKDGDLISLALSGEFDVIAHGCNCFCNMGAGIAVSMRNTFGADLFPLEIARDWEYVYDQGLSDEKRWFDTGHKGDINKLGQIDYQTKYLIPRGMEVIPMNHNPFTDLRQLPQLTVVNAYTQYRYGRNHADGDIAPVDLSAIVMCMKKINHIFKGKHIGLPKIGSGLGGGNWETIEQLVKTQLKDCDVTIVNYVP